VLESMAPSSTPTLGAACLSSFPSAVAYSSADVPRIFAHADAARKDPLLLNLEPRAGAAALHVDTALLPLLVCAKHQESLSFVAAFSHTAQKSGKNSLHKERLASSGCKKL